MNDHLVHSIHNPSAAHTPARTFHPQLFGVMVVGCFAWFVTGCSDQRRSDADVAASVQGESLELYRRQPIGLPFKSPPKISHLQLFDLDADEAQDVIVCDCENHTVSWLRQTEPGVFEERVLASDLQAPAHSECVDVDRDGDVDILVASLGVLFPNNEKIGSVVLLENDGQQQFAARTLLRDVARVADVRSGDLDEDGDLDLVVTHFGYHQGEVRWMENIGDGQFESHILQSLPGGIHGVVGHMNQDSHLDIVVLISQDTEGVYLFLGDGTGNFDESLVYQADTVDYGSSGLWVHDLDTDGDQDILFTNGDAYDYSPPHPWPWHGVQWLENRGNGQFDYHRLTSFGGAVCAQPGDIDGDGDLDLWVSSTFNEWDNPSAQSIILLRNQGNMSFVKHSLSNQPTHIQSLVVHDFDADGILDLVSGGMHVAEPYDRVQRLVFWRGEPLPIETVGRVSLEF